jgi:signal transduction histidine kinase
MKTDRGQEKHEWKGLGVLYRWMLFWRESHAAYAILPTICGVFEMLLVAKYMFVPAEPMYENTGEQTELLYLVSVCAVSVLLLLIRKKYAFLVMIGECLIILLSSFQHLQMYTAIAFLGSLYVCITTGTIAQTGIGTLVAISTVLMMTITDKVGQSDAIRIVYPFELTIAVVTASAFFARYIYEQGSSMVQTQLQYKRIQKAEEQRNEAVSVARVVAEIHDGVGHDLTAIIAITEGLMNVTDDEESRTAIETIGLLSRKALQNTRDGLRTLKTRIATEQFGPLHSWNEIQEILDNVRKTGKEALLIETGDRPDDPQQADLCFTITRESITNAMRHGTGISRIVATWNHNADGSLNIIVKDNGRKQQERNTSQGTGLARLIRQVEETGGSMTSGFNPEGRGWTVQASVPGIVKDKDVDTSDRSNSSDD